jgi:hypothetical protein
MLKNLFIGQEVLIVKGTLFRGFKGQFMDDIKSNARFDKTYCKLQICNHVIGFNPANFKFTDDAIQKEWENYLMHNKIGD